jgi:hypothetical protein
MKLDVALGADWLRRLPAFSAQRERTARPGCHNKLTQEPATLRQVLHFGDLLLHVAQPT